MIWKNYSYKWFTFDDLNASVNNIVLQDVQRWITLSTNIYNKASYHGVNSSYSLAGWRVFTFTWKIFGVTREERANGQSKLNNIIKPEGIFWDNKGFYELSWYEDNWEKVKVQAKVYSMPTYSTDVWSTVIDFSFDLFAEKPVFQWYTDKIENTIATTIMGGTTLPTTLPAVLNWYIIITFKEWFIYDIDWNILEDVEFNPIQELVQEWAWTFPNANNLWNFEAPCKIVLKWDLHNPKITNLANNRYFWLNTNTTNLVIDNTWSDFIVTDEGVNVKQYRQTGSKQMFIAPWVNQFVVYADNLSVNTTYEITIYYNDTYINN